MRTEMQARFVLMVVAILAAGATATAQTDARTASKPRTELAVEYNAVHSNAPTAGCGCFFLNGGSASFAWPFGAGHFAIAGDVSVTHTGGISDAMGEGRDLTLSTFTGGIRYTPRLGNAALRPFGQALAGAVHTSGSLVQSEDISVSNSGAAFAANLGGGLDLHANQRFSLRLIEANYLVTTVNNGTNNHQNNLRLGAGVVFHF